MSEQPSYNPYNQSRATVIEDIIPRHLDDESAAAAFEFVAWLRANNMQPVWTNWLTWRAVYKGEVICSVQLPFPGHLRPWTVTPALCYAENYQNSIINEGLRDIYMKNTAVFCVHGPGQTGVGCSPNKPCAGGKTKTFLGKELAGICGSNCNSSFLKIWDPSEKDVKGIKRLLELEQKAREAKPPKDTSNNKEEQNDDYQNENDKKAPAKIDEVAAKLLDGEKLERLLDFVAWIKKNKLSLAKAYGNVWKINNKGKTIGRIGVNLQGAYNAGAWNIGFNLDGLHDGNLLADERSKEIAWANVNTCKGGGCLQRPCRTILGREFDRVCHGGLMFWNPGAADMECVRQLISAVIG